MTFIQSPPHRKSDLSYTYLTLAMPSIQLLKAFQWLLITLRIIPKSMAYKSPQVLILTYLTTFLLPLHFSPSGHLSIPGPARFLPSSEPLPCLRTFSFLFTPSCPLRIIHNSVVTPQGSPLYFSDWVDQILPLNPLLAPYVFPFQNLSQLQLYIFLQNYLAHTDSAKKL